jgi:hypothetical protein
MKREDDLINWQLQCGIFTRFASILSRYSREA